MAQTQSPASTADAAAIDTTEVKARARFDKGVQFFRAGDIDAAAAEFIASRELRLSRSATENAAICLRKLARYDESLALYESMLRDFTDLEPYIREAVQRAVIALRPLVGTIDVVDAEPGALVVVNLRWRGDYPLLEPLRVPAGSHLLRVFKLGYEPFEKWVDIAGGTTGRVSTPLVKLKVTGTIQVSEVEGKELKVFIDGFDAGETGKQLWTGVIAPGQHTIWLQGEGDWGTLPIAVTVHANAVTPVRLSARELTSKLKIRTTPASATVALDGVDLGHGLWEGKVSPGKHKIEVAAEGFVLYVKEIEFQPAKQEALNVSLDRDPTHPLWKDNRGRFFIEGSAGLSLIPSFGGDLPGMCTGACTMWPGIAVMPRVRVGYRFPSLFLVGLEVGYLYARQTIFNRATTVEPKGMPLNPGVVDDTLSLNGVVVGGAAGIRFGKKFPVRLGFGAGVFLGRGQDRRAGEFATCEGGRLDGTGNAITTCVPVGRYSVDKTQGTTISATYVAPELRVSFPLAKRFELWAGIEGLIVLLKELNWEPNAALVLAGDDGQGVMPTDDAGYTERYTGRAVVGGQIGFGARYEF